MTLYSCRSGKIIEQSIGPDIELPESAPTVLFVHGFAADERDVELAYTNMQAHYAQFGIRCIGFSWPTATGISPFHYWHDLNRTIPHTVPILSDLLDDLDEDHRLVAIQGHSMGTILIMETMKHRADAGIIYDPIRIILHGGDASLKHFSRNRRYGKFAHVFPNLRSYYSKGDGVLRFWAKLVRLFVDRVGSHPLPDDKPTTWESFDAEKIADYEIDHETYRRSAKVLDHTARWIMWDSVFEERRRELESQWTKKTKAGPRKSLKGLWADIDISDKEIDDNRREMWANFGDRMP